MQLLLVYRRPSLQRVNQKQLRVERSKQQHERAEHEALDDAVFDQAVRQVAGNEREVEHGYDGCEARLLEPGNDLEQADQGHEGREKRQQSKRPEDAALNQ